jgi:hypothetical protein
MQQPTNGGSGKEGCRPRRRHHRKNVIFLNGPNFLSECSKLLYQVSLRYPDSLVKKK